MNRRILLSALSLALLLVMVVVLAYVNQFGAQQSTSQGTWGEFGDYFAGLLNPIFSLLAFGALMYSLVLQHEESHKNQARFDAQYREMTRTRHLEAMLRAFDMLGAEEARKQRRFIYTQLKSSPDRLSAEEQWVVEQVTVTFDRLGLLVQMGLVPPKELFQGHCEVVIRAWMQLKPYVYYHRSRVGGRHGHNFEELAKSAQKYFSTEFPGQEVKVIDAWAPAERETRA